MAEAGREAYSSEQEFDNLEDEARTGDGGIISKTVAIQGFSSDTSQEVLEMYFENFRRSGGGDIEEFQITDGIAYATFKEIEVTQRVVSRSSHQVAGQTLNVTLFCLPPQKPCYENRVLILGLNYAITDELLTNFLETETGVNIIEFLHGGKEEKVVVTFSDDIDFPTLRKACKERRIEGTFLQIVKVAISNCILVQNLQPSTSHDTILFYFENKRRSGGGEVERVEMNTEERYCLVYFKDHSVIDRVLCQSHRVDATDVEVHLHHECLGRRSSADRSDPCLRKSNPGSLDNAALEAKKTENLVKEETSSTVSSNPDEEGEFVKVPEWQENEGRNCALSLLVKYRKAHGKKTIRDMKEVPSSLNFLAFWNFYTKTKQGQQMLSEIMGKHGCLVAVSSDDDDLFIFEICDRNFEQESDISDFINVVLDDVYKCAQQSLYSDIFLVDHRMQGDILQKIREAKELECAWIDFFGEQDPDAIYVVCTKNDKPAILKAATAIIADCKVCFENHEEKVTVDLMWQKVLKTFGYLQEIHGKFSNLSITPDENKGVFVLKGPRDESKAAADYLLELFGTARTEVHEKIFSPGCQFEILTYPAMCDYVNSCVLKPSTTYTWMPNVQTKNVHIFSTSSEEVRGLDKLIKGCIKEKAYVFSKTDEIVQLERGTLLPELKEKYKGKVLICTAGNNTLVVTTADDIFESVDAAIQEIIRKERGSDPPISRTEKGDKRDEQSASKSELKATDISMKNKNSHPEQKATSDPSKEDLQESFKFCGNSDKLDVKEIIRTEIGTHIPASRNEKGDKRDKQAASEPELKATDMSIKTEKSHPEKNITSDPSKGDLQCSLTFCSDSDKLGLELEPSHGMNRKMDDKRTSADTKVGTANIGAVTGILFVQQDSSELKRDAVQKMNQGCYEKIMLSSNEQQIAEKAASLVKNEFPAIFIKRTSDIIIMKGENADTFEKAKHKMKVALGRVKIISHGIRGRNQPADSKSFSSLRQDDRMKANPVCIELNSHISLHKAAITSKTYHTREGITVSIYQGNIVSLLVDCIVNSTNQNLSHGGGVALAIAKAAGKEFDQEGEEYVRKNGPVPVTQCCVTSAGRLPYEYVIHVVGPQWHDYKHDEKDRCGNDLKMTIVNCLIEANRLKVTSIAIPAISSGIFGVPKPLCAQMYAQGVLEFSKTCGLRSIKEIHFVDMLWEICQLTQLAFQTELNNSSHK